MADKDVIEMDPTMTDALRVELEYMSGSQRAAVLMLLLGEQQASEIIKYLDPKEVQALGGAMVSVSDVSQEAVNVILDDFVATIKKQSSLGLGTTEYVEKVFRRALGDDKAASVLGRIMPGQGTKGLDILSWMDARGIADPNFLQALDGGAERRGTPSGSALTSQTGLTFSWTRHP